MENPLENMDDFSGRSPKTFWKAPIWNQRPVQDDNELTNVNTIYHIIR